MCMSKKTGAILKTGDLTFLCDSQPPMFSFYDATKPMYTSRRNLPPSKIDDSKVSKSYVFTLHFKLRFQKNYVSSIFFVVNLTIMGKS